MLLLTYRYSYLTKHINSSLINNFNPLPSSTSSSPKYYPKLIRYSSSSSYPIRVAVVGSGPAGFYTTQKLLKNEDINVDIYEKLPIPFGLVRYGVAPDHPEVKNVIKSFTNVANNNRVGFYGNVSLGSSISLDDLIEAYHAVVLCYGSAQDKLLNIEGESTTKNTISARNFVGWYNGLPEDKDLNINLDCDTGCIIGQGNVALDCARILVRPKNLEKTDITSYAQNLLAESKIKRLYIIGRRGPIQTSFTTKELREILNLEGCKVSLDPETIFSDHKVELPNLIKLSRHRRRLTELMLTSTVGVSQSKTIGEINGVELIFKFLSKPTKINADPETGHVKSLELQKTNYSNLDDFMDEKAKPNDLDEHEIINCGLVIRSIGFKAVILDNTLPMDNRLECIMNTNGRIHGHRSLYCSGWLATGATGVIAGTLNSSHITAQSILDDINRRDLPDITRRKGGFDRIRSKLAGQKVVHFSDWLQIDELERRLGESIGKSREKFVDINTILNLVNEKDSNK